MEQPAEKSLAVFILADVSGSMAGEPLRAMQEGIAALGKELRKNPDAGLQISLFTYGRTVAQATPLLPPANFAVPQMTAGGFTPLGAALARAAAIAIKTPRALLLILSDGHATDEFAASSASLAGQNVPCVLASLKPADFQAAPRGMRATKVRLARADAAGALFLWLAEVVRATLDAQAHPPLPPGVVAWQEEDGDLVELLPAVVAPPLAAPQNSGTQPHDDDEIIVPQPEEEEVRSRRKTTILGAQASTRREAAATSEAQAELEARPYFSSSIEDLEALAVTSDVGVLTLIADELGHRNTARAHDLKTMIQLRLSKRLAPPPVLPQPPLPSRKRGGLFDHLIGA